MTASEFEKTVNARRAVVSDLDPVVEFLAPFVKSKQLLPRDVSELQLLLANGFVAENNGKVVGFAAVEVYSPKMAEVQCLAVDANFRGIGIGRQLVQLCVQRTRDLKIRELMAITSSDTFLIECGFDYSLPDQKRALFVETWKPED